MGVGAPPRGGAGRSRRRSEAAERVESCASACGEASPGLRGREVPQVMAPPSCGWMARCSGRKAWAGRRTRGAGGRALKGRKTRRVTASGHGEIPAAVGTDSQGEQGFEVDEAGGTGRFRREWSEQTGSTPSGARKESSSPREDPGCCARVWWSVKPGDRPRAARSSTPVENGTGAGGAERRSTIPARGTL